MLYQSFISTINQITNKEMATISVEERVVFIFQCSNRKTWTLRTKVGSCSSRASFQWKPHLTFDPQSSSLFLEEVIPNSKLSYLHFKSRLHHFLNFAADWEELVK